MSSESTPVRERHSLTLDQRRALRRWANSQASRPSHKACIEWFQAQYNQTISQSTVSHSLSPKYSRLDGDPQLSGSRLRFGNWPDVEKLVLLWHQQVVSSGRQPSNEDLKAKAAAIFAQLPRYRDEQPPEFSPGWIHRFKKRYGLLIRRQRRHAAGGPNPVDDIPYLVDAVPRFMTIGPETSPAAIRDAVQRLIGFEPSLAICARVRDEVVHRLENPIQPGGDPEQPQPQPQPQPQQGQQIQPPPMGYENVAPELTGAGGDLEPPAPDDDPEVVLQNALRQMQQEEADAEAEAAAAREDRDRSERGGMPGLSTPSSTAAAAAAAAAPTFHTQSISYAQHAAAGALASTPVVNRAPVAVTPQPQQRPQSQSQPPQHLPQQQHHQPAHHAAQPSPVSMPRFITPNDEEQLNLTPITSGGAVSATDRPVRCPYCVNQRMLRTIKEAVEHMSTHVIV